METCESLDGDRTDDEVVEIDGRGLLLLVSALPSELLRGLTGGDGVGPFAYSGMARKGTCGLRLVRNLLLGWLRRDSCEREVLDGLLCSTGLKTLSREPMLGFDVPVLGRSGYSSSESDERDSTLVAFGSKSAKLSVILDALDVRVCLLETLVAYSPGGEARFEEVIDARGFSAMGPQSSPGEYAGNGLHETELKEGETWCRGLLVDGDDVAALCRESLRGSATDPDSTSCSLVRLDGADAVAS